MATGGNSGYLLILLRIIQAARGVENGIAQVRKKIPKKEINYLMIARTNKEEGF
jgi:ribosomal protein L7Ae-like RNA K-turn-binding protein